MKKVPKSLQTWFIIHFIVDYLFGLPLLITPIWTLQLFGFTVVEPVTARLVGAALLGIGGASLYAHKKGYESYKSLLMLKILWSGGAIFGLLLSLWQSAPVSVWLFVVIFALFSGVWIYYFRKL